MITQWFSKLGQLSLISFIIVLTGCGGGGVGDFKPLNKADDDTDAVDISLTSGAVKGPIAFSEVRLYKVDLSSDHYAAYNDTANAVFKMFADSNLYIDQGNLISADNKSSSEALESLRTIINNASYISDLDYFRSKVKAASSIQEAKVLLDVYLGRPDIPDESSVDIGLLTKETNQLVADRVEKALNSYADLNSFIYELDKVIGFYDEVAQASSFNDISDSISRFSHFELDPVKKNSWLLISEEFTKLKSLAQTKMQIISLFESKELVNQAAALNDSVAHKNLKDLEDELDSASSPVDLKSEVYLAAKKEGNQTIKSGLMSVYYEIVTFEDFISTIRNDRAIYSFAGVRESVSSVGSLSELYGELYSTLKGSAEAAFDEILLSTDSLPSEDERVLDSGVSTDSSIVENLEIGKYRGFIYLEAKATSSSVDLNTGKAPIFSQMASLIHTDDILGYGDNQRFDESIYFIKNGIIQRDSDGEILTNDKEIENEANDEVLTVSPSRFATPLTSLAVDISKLKVLDLTPQIIKLSINSDYADSSYSQKLNYFRMDEAELYNVLSNAQRLVADALNVTEGESLSSIFSQSPITLPHMKYLPNTLLNTYRYRSSVEYYGALLDALKNNSNLSFDSLHHLIAKDLYDGKINGKQEGVTLAELNDIENLSYFSTRKPSEATIMGTELKVSEIGLLIEREFNQVLENQTFGEFQGEINQLSFIAASGGNLQTGSDSGGLDGYGGLRSLSVDYTEALVVPLDSDLNLSLPIIEAVDGGNLLDQPCASMGPNCVLVGDINVDMGVLLSVVSAPNNHNATTLATLTNQGSNRALQINIDSTVPGDYLIHVQLSTPLTHSNLPNGNKLGFYLPVKVINLNELEFRLVSKQSNANSNDTVYVDDQLIVEVKATKEICQLYDACGTDNSKLGEFLSIDSLNSLFSIEYFSDVAGSRSSYQDAISFVESDTMPQTVISNLTADEKIGARISYNQKDSNISLGEVSQQVSGGADDSTPACDSLVLSQTSIDHLADCFSTLLTETDSKNALKFENLDETWYFDQAWNYIIRINNSLNAFAGAVLIPESSRGESPGVSNVLYDGAAQRVYINLQNGDIYFYSLNSMKVSPFYIDIATQPVYSWQLIDTNLLINWESDTLDSVILNADGDRVEFSYGTKYPYSERKLTPKLGGLELSNFVNEIQASYNIERFVNGEMLVIDGRLAGDSLSLESGQTRFGDVLTLTLNFFSDDDTSIEYRYESLVLDNDGFSFDPLIFAEQGSPIVVASGLDLSQSKVKENLYVKWFVNDSNASEFEFRQIGSQFPYSYSANKLEFGDIVSAEIFLRRSQELSSSSDILVASLQSPNIGDLTTFSPISDIDYWTENLNLVEPGFKARVISGVDNDDFFNIESFKPIWYLNGSQVPGENSFEFPTLPSTYIRFGDQVSVLYEITVNGLTVTSPTLDLPVINLSPEDSVFSLSPQVVAEGSDVGLDTSIINPDNLSNITALWFINGVLDETEQSLVYPGSKLSFGDTIRLELVRAFEDRESVPFSHKEAIAYVGVNLAKLNNTDSDITSHLDSDGDGIPNYRDYFRFDGSCSVAGEGVPDDSDHDGVPDLVELSSSVNSNPFIADTDSDGLSDSLEVTLNTSLINADSDGDGYSDGFEYIFESNPNDASSPQIASDIDKDGLSDEQELTLNTLVRNSDTDGDGLEDGLEAKLGTDPLTVDFDGDFLSDGAEVKVIGSNPLLADSDDIPDGIIDGIEVAITRTHPLLGDTDNDGVIDSAEPENIALLGQSLYDVLYVSDFNNYNNGRGVNVTAPGTCFVTQLSHNVPDKVIYTQEQQNDSDSYQEVLFLNRNSTQLIRFDAQQGAFLPTLDRGNISAQISSASYSRLSSDMLYLGFNDGSIWLVDLSNDTPNFSLKYSMPDNNPVNTLLDEGDVLFAATSVLDGPDQIYVFDHSVEDMTPINSHSFQTTVQLSEAKWESPLSSRLWAVSNDGQELVSLEFNDVSKTFTTEAYGSNQWLTNPIYLRDDRFITSSSGIEFDINLKSFGFADSGEFLQGIYHNEHHVVAPTTFSGFKLLYLENGGWGYRKSLLDREIVSFIPSGFNTLAISKPRVTSPGSNSAFQFDLIATGDSDSNGLPQWWESIYTDGTLAEFDSFQQPDSYEFAEQSDNGPIRNDTADDADMDDDGVSNGDELALGSCAVKGARCTDPSDSDQDGLSDLFEFEYEYIDNSNNVLRLLLTSNDTDKDGLLDYDEVVRFNTVPVTSDSDGDNICDTFEVLVLNTDPLNKDTDADGREDGEELGISVLDCELLNLDNRISDPLVADSDNDGLSDKEEFDLGTLPENPDSDNDGLLDGDDEAFGEGHALNPVARDGVTNDGLIDRDGDGLSDSFELYVINSDPDLVDSDNDKINDFIEVKQLGTNPNSIDTDGDLICDRFEDISNLSQSDYFDTDPTSSDSDGDGLNDNVELGVTSDIISCDALPEFEMISDPTKVDSDLDGINDNEEVAYRYDSYSDEFLIKYPSVNLSINPMAQDSDGDRLCDSIELGITNPAEKDTDFDGLDDARELNIVLNPESSDIYCTPIVYDSANLTKPFVADTDGDGLLDGYEVLNTGTDPLDTDSDNDGIIDGDEDRDGDGLSDRIELELFYQTNGELLFDNADSDGDLINDAEDDLDGDGLSNIKELAYGTCVVYDEVRCSTPEDSDKDGLSDYDEVTKADETGSNPLVVDSDEDGLTDKEEEALGTSPVLADTDLDGINDFDERSLRTTATDPDSDNDFLIDGMDPRPLDPDSDGDSILDGIEVHILGTNPSQEDTDDDGLLDGEEVWVYAYKGQTDTLLAYGDDPDVKLNSRAGIPDADSPPVEDEFEADENGERSSFAIPNSFDGSNEETKAEYKLFALNSIRVVTVDGERKLTEPTVDNIVEGIGSLHVRYISNPVALDSDFDGLTDYVELMEIEKHFGHTQFDVNPSITGTSGKKSNRTNFKVSDPLRAFTYSADQEAVILQSCYVCETVGDASSTVVSYCPTCSQFILDELPSPGQYSCTLCSAPSEQNIALDEFYAKALATNPVDSVALPTKSNGDSNGVILNDGVKDADNDLYVNLLDQNNEATSVIVADSDNDGLPDGIESFVTKSDPGLPDTDGDGLFDGIGGQEDEALYEVLFDPNGVRELNDAADSCANEEYRINNVAGRDYCVSVSFVSDPTRSDSDNDGIPDRAVSEDSQIIIDSYPLDKSCHRTEDGVIDTNNVLERQCYSSWMAERLSIDQVSSASWDVDGASNNFIALTGNSWGRIVRYNLSAANEESYYSPHIDVAQNVIIETSGSTQRLYFADDSGLIRYQGFAQNEVIDFAQVPAMYSNIVKMLSAGSKLIVIANDGVSSNSYSLLTYDSDGILLGLPQSISEIINPETGIAYCAETGCNSAIDLYFIVASNNHANSEILSVSIDPVNSSMSVPLISDSFSSVDSPLEGPIEISEDASQLYIGSGQKLVRETLALPVGGGELKKAYGHSSFNKFYDIKEENKHFVALVEDNSSIYNTETSISVYVEDNNTLSDEQSGESAKYLIKQMAEDERIIKILPQRVNGQNDLAFFSVYESLVDITPIGVTDQDSDGMPGVFELVYGLNDNDPSDKFGDLDDDGLTNIEEYLLKTKPNNPDSDGNGVSDLKDVMN